MCIEKYLVDIIIFAKYIYYSFKCLFSVWNVIQRFSSNNDLISLFFDVNFIIRNNLFCMRPLAQKYELSAMTYLLVFYFLKTKKYIYFFLISRKGIKKFNLMIKTVMCNKWRHQILILLLHLSKFYAFGERESFHNFTKLL